jgi:membrane-associated phospholipid phosphatase
MKYSPNRYFKEQWLFLVIYAAALFVAFYFLSKYSRTDGHVLINQYWHPFFDHFFMYFTHIGDGIFGVLVLLIMVFFNWRLALVGAIGFVLSGAITQFLKKIIYDDVRRPIIELWDYFHYDSTSHLVELHGSIQYSNSFPSGHATSAFAIFTFLALYSTNKWIGLLCILIALLAAISRVYLSEHFTEDIVVGSIIGTLSMWTVMTAYSSLYIKNNEVSA